MQKYFYQALGVGLILLLLAGVSSCASRSHQVRHLASDLSMLAPGSSEQEVRVVMGPPDIRRPAPGGGEEWLYLENQLSWMRRVRLVGGWLGHEDYHLAVITIRDGRLINAVYRALTEQEFREQGGQSRSDS